MSSTNAGSRLGAAATAVLLLLALPASTFAPAAAAHLDVSAAPLQYWDTTDLPAMPKPPDLSVCGPLSDYDDVVYGTSGPDEIPAANDSRIVIGLSGDDVISGGNHDDCLIGGPGSDSIFGGNGQDVLVGGAGADHLDGGNGKDVLHAGDPGDACVVDGAPDEVIGACE